MVCTRLVTLPEVDIFTVVHDQQFKKGDFPVDGALVLNSLRCALGVSLKTPGGKVQLSNILYSKGILVSSSIRSRPTHFTRPIERSLWQEADEPDSAGERDVLLISVRSSKKDAN